MGKKQVAVSGEMSLEEKAAKFDEQESKKILQKKKDRFYWERTKWEVAEMKRVIMENKLEEEIKPFPRVLEEYV